jgi:Holliday junction resolvase-like predicted endonuclease
LARIGESNVEEQGSSMTWREFEELAERIFKSFGFTTFRNYRLKKPVAEIDILATRLDTAFAIDCKHWKRTVGSATMHKVSERQLERARRVVRLESIQKVIPVVITLHDEFLQVLEDGTPIVPIQKISDFVLNWEADPRIRVISKLDV